jgi:branched-chain amino acid transport system substrate-binding protein
MRRFWIIGVAAILVVIAIFLLVKPSGQPSQLTASINVPLTGPISLPTKSFQEAALFAVDDLKADGTAVKFALKWEDNQAKPSLAVTLAQQQRGNPADVFYVGYGSELEAALPVLEEAARPIFAFSFLASATDHPLVFRNIVSYKIEAPVFVEYARQRGAKKVVAIFHDLPDAHEQFKQLVVPGLKEIGIAESDVTLFPYPLGDPDFRTIATKAKQGNPDLVIISGFQQNLVPLVKALKTTGLATNDGNTIATFSLLDLRAITSDEVLEGIAAAIPEFMLSPSPRAIEFQNRFQAKFNRPASFNEFSAYDFVLLMADLSARLPADSSAHQVVQAVKSTDIDGVSGRLRFDEEGDILYPTRAAIYRDGKLVPVPQ